MFMTLWYENSGFRLIYQFGINLHECLFQKSQITRAIHKKIICLKKFTEKMNDPKYQGPIENLLNISENVRKPIDNVWSIFHNLR